MEKEVLYEIGNKGSKITTYKDGSMKVEGARIEINEPTQLDRIESKVDKILHILENGDLSTPVVIDREIIADTIYPYVTGR